MGQYIVDLCSVSNSVKIEDHIPHDDCNIFHYTSPQGLSGIISKHELWFSDRAYMNDKSEGMYTIQLCIDEVEKLGFTNPTLKKHFIEECNKQRIDPQVDHFYPFLCSFSLDGDSLCLWNYYTKGAGIKGYNLHFRSNELLKALEPETYPDREDHTKPIGGKVIYKRDAQIQIIKSIVRKFDELSKERDNNRYDQMTASLLLDRIRMIGMFFKDECFAIENEYRIVFSVFLEADCKLVSVGNKQLFRENNGVFIPYIAVKFKKACLAGITISPTMEEEQTRQSVKRLATNVCRDDDPADVYSGLLENGAIKTSRIPVRY